MKGRRKKKKMHGVCLPVIDRIKHSLIGVSMNLLNRMLKRHVLFSDDQLSLLKVR